MTGGVTGSLKIPVVTSLPWQVTSLGNPTFTDKTLMFVHRLTCGRAGNSSANRAPLRTENSWYPADPRL